MTATTLIQVMYSRVRLEDRSTYRSTSTNTSPNLSIVRGLAQQPTSSIIRLAFQQSSWKPRCSKRRKECFRIKRLGLDQLATSKTKIWWAKSTQLGKLAAQYDESMWLDLRLKIASLSKKELCEFLKSSIKLLYKCKRMKPNSLLKRKNLLNKFSKLPSTN